jgi:hypothetical protein
MSQPDGLERSTAAPERRGEEPLPAEAQRGAVAPGSLAWASAVGNQAVQGLARSRAAASVAREESETEEEETESPGGAPSAAAAGPVSETEEDETES